MASRLPLRPLGAGVNTQCISFSPRMYYPPPSLLLPPLSFPGSFPYSRPLKRRISPSFSPFSAPSISLFPSKLSPMYTRADCGRGGGSISFFPSAAIAVFLGMCTVLCIVRRREGGSPPVLCTVHVWKGSSSSVYNEGDDLIQAGGEGKKRRVSNILPADFVASVCRGGKVRRRDKNP